MTGSSIEMETTTQPRGAVAAKDTAKTNLRSMDDPPSPSAHKRSPYWRRPKEKIGEILDGWPRLVAITRNQFLFMLLLAVSFIMGNIISKIEGPSEIELNDSYMRRVYMTRQLPIEETIYNLITLPASCMVRLRTKLNEAEQEHNNNTTNNETEFSLWNNDNSTVAADIDFTIESYINRAISDLNYLRMDAVLLKNTNTTWEEFYKFANVSFEESRDIFGENSRTDSPVATADITDTDYFDYLDEIDASNPSMEQKILGYAKACRGIAQELVMSLLDFTIEVNSVEEESKVGSDGLSFNWIRCWDQSLYGRKQFNIRAEDPRRNASFLTSQTVYFDQQWNKNRTALFDLYVAEGKCDEQSDVEKTNNNSTSDKIFRTSSKSSCYWNATMTSVSKATGAEGCMPNTASASWFWFTVMTTVGYGNATPNTFTSRLLVYCFGWLMIVAFGGIMIANANTLTALLDDLFRRTNLSWLKRPVYSTPLWAMTSFCYIILVAWYARRYWDLYIPHDAYTLGESYWFSYITLLTVGFGDFYVQPQGLFAPDVIIWTTLLLHGFGILASFLDRFSDLIESWLPTRKEPFEYHLARTDILGTGINTPYSKSLDVLRELVEEHFGEDDRDGRADDPLQARKRSSFSGRDDFALTPDGQTINLHRIKILTEKKTLLIKLLLENQSELEERMASSAAHSCAYNNKGQERNLSSMFLTAHASIFYSRDGSSVSLPMPTAEALEQDEEVLRSILFHTQELRRHLDNTSIENDEKGGP